MAELTDCLVRNTTPYRTVDQSKTVDGTGAVWAIATADSDPGYDRGHAVVEGFEGTGVLDGWALVVTEGLHIEA